MSYRHCSRMQAYLEGRPEPWPYSIHLPTNGMTPEQLVEELHRMGFTSAHLDDGPTPQFVQGPVTVEPMPMPDHPRVFDLEFKYGRDK
jgi:hypothetical protein